MSDEKADRWRWWAGPDEETFTQGPFDAREDAIDEALSQGDYVEIQHDDGSWSVGIYVAEHKGTYYECDECGVVEKACDACAECLMSDEPRFFFATTRNDEFVVLPHPNDADGGMGGGVNAMTDIPEDVMKAAREIWRGHEPKSSDEDVCRIIARAILADREKRVKVKPLEWVPHYTTPDGEREFAVTSFGGTYHVNNNGWWHPLDTLHACEDKAAAKAAAQSDYDRRILATLEFTDELALEDEPDSLTVAYMAGEAKGKERLAAAEAHAEKLAEALRGMLGHSCIADAGGDMKDQEDHDAEREARAALAAHEARKARS